MKKKVLLIASGGLDKSGVPSVMMATVRAMRDQCTFDILLSTESKGYYEQEFLSYGGKIFRVPKKRSSVFLFHRIAELFWPVFLYIETRRLLRANGPYDIIHCHNDFDMAGCLAAGAGENILVRIGHIHKTWNRAGGPVTRIYRGLCRKVINRCATVRTGCSAVANRFFFGEKVSTQILFNPYRDDLFFFDERCNPPENVMITQVGYFCPNKNQLFTLNVFRNLAEELPQARLCFVGFDQGEYGRSVKREALRLGLEGRVDFLPSDCDLPALLRRSSLMLFPSRTEGFGIVLIEAQAMGVRCYASDTVPRETDAGGVSYLPLSDGPEAWAQTILQENHFKEKRAYNCLAFSTASYEGRIRMLYKVKECGR